MGRRPESEEKKAARGTLRADREQKDVVFTPLEAKRYAPKELVDDYAKKEYKKLSDRLIQDGMVAEVDEALLVSYCNEISKYMRLTKEIFDAETVDKAKLNECNQALKNASALGVLFGLTPIGRSKVKAQNPRKENSPEEEAKNMLEKLRGKVVKINNG